MRRIPAIVVFLIYIAVAMTLTVSVVPKANDHIIGDSESDVWAHLWGFWRTEKSLIENHEFPYELHNLNFPHGGKLYHIDSLNSIFMIPLKKLFGPMLGFNILVWLQIAFGGLGMYLFARTMIDRFSLAFMAGIIYGFCSFVISFVLASGVSERLNVGWIPLFFYFLMNILQKGGARNYLLAALTYFFAAFGCWKYGLFTFNITMFFAIFLLIRPLVLKAIKMEEQETQLKQYYFNLIIKKLAPVALLCGLAVIPITMAASDSIGDENGILQRKSMMFWDGKKSLGGMQTEPLHETKLFALEDFILPFNRNMHITKNFDLLYQAVYIGWGVMILAIASLFSKKKYSIFFFSTGVLFTLLALGPYITFTHNSSEYKSLIYFFLARIIPYFTTLHAPWEYCLPAMMCFAVCAAFGLEHLMKYINEKRRNLATAAVVMIVAFDQFIISPVLVPVPIAKVEVPDFYYELYENDKGEIYGVFDFPMHRAYSRLVPEEYFYFQTIHEKPIPYGINSGWVNYDPFWSRLNQFQAGIDHELPPVDMNTIQAIKFLGKNNFRYFIVHEKNVNSGRLQVFKKYFTMLFGKPFAENQDLIVFRINPWDDSKSAEEIMDRLNNLESKTFQVESDFHPPPMEISELR